MNYITDLLPSPSDNLINPLLDAGYLPHALIRLGIRRQLAERLASISTTSLSSAYDSKMQYVKLLRTRPIAVETQTANSQHYEVGTGVLRGMLGPRMKYSACLYEKAERARVEGSGGEGESLAQAEVEMLRLYGERAEIEDGMRVLDLGCGWGSASLYLAEVYPNVRITAFSNSRTQKAYIDSVVNSKNLTNLRVITGDVVDYEFTSESFDRVISIELFEHMKNYALLLKKVSRALVPGGKAFVHIFAHRSTPYDFESGWMKEHFFTGGTMPSADLLLYFQEDLRVKRQWWVSGMHYARTCEDWLTKMLKEKESIWPALVETYGRKEENGGEVDEKNVTTWWNRWQVFYMACAELFKWDGGDTWGVAHYLFQKPE